MQADEHQCRLHYDSMHVIHQELEEQRRKEVAEREAMERWKEEERRKFQQEIGNLRQLFLQEFKEMSSKSCTMEAVSVHMCNFHI